MHFVMRVAIAVLCGFLIGLFISAVSDRGLRITVNDRAYVIRLNPPEAK